MNYNTCMRPIIDNNSQTIHISMLGREWLIERPASLEELWNRLAEAPPGTEPEEPGRNGLAGIDMNTLARAFEEDDRIPYWAEIWPSGIALGEWLHQQKKRVNGRLCLEMGCGLGLSAAAGAMAGGCVLGMDYEPIALYYAYRNSRKNLQPGGPGSVHFAAADWRRPAFKKGAFELIWAGDIMYERRFMAPVADFLEHCLAPGGTVWIAEPGRGIYPDFTRGMHARGWRSAIAARLRAALPESGASPADIQIWELSRRTT